MVIFMKKYLNFILIISLNIINISCISIRNGDDLNINKNSLLYKGDKKKSCLIIISSEIISKINLNIQNISVQVNFDLKIFNDLIISSKKVINELNYFSKHSVYYNFHSSIVREQDILKPLLENIPKKTMNVDLLYKPIEFDKSYIKRYKQLRDIYEKKIVNSLNNYDQIMYINIQIRFPNELDAFHNNIGLLNTLSCTLIPFWSRSEITITALVYDRKKNIKHKYIYNDKEITISQTCLLPLHFIFTKERVYKKIMNDAMLYILKQGNDENIF